MTEELGQNIPSNSHVQSATKIPIPIQVRELTVFDSFYTKEAVSRGPNYDVRALRESLVQGLEVAPKFRDRFVSKNKNHPFEWLRTSLYEKELLPSDP